MTQTANSVQETTAVQETSETTSEQTISAAALVSYLLKMLEGPDVDHPEVWDFVAGLGDQAGVMLDELTLLTALPISWTDDVLRAVILAVVGRIEEAENL